MNEKKTVRMILYDDGAVEWVPQALVKTRCQMDIYFFPFDHQLCSINIGSTAYDEQELELKWRNDKSHTIDFSDYVISMEWFTDGDRHREHEKQLELLGINVTNKTLPKDCCVRSELDKRTRKFVYGPGNEEITRTFSVMKFHLKLERTRTVFVFSLITPSGLLTALTMVVFWLPPESPVKMMLGLNIFIAFMVLLQLLARSIPSSINRFPMVGTYFAFNMLLITLSTILVTLTINLYLRGDRNGKLPRCLRRVVVEGIGRLLLVRQYIPLPDESKLNIVSGKLVKKSPELELRESSKFSYSDDDFDTVDKSKKMPVSTIPKPLTMEATSPTTTGDLQSEDSPVMLSNTSNLERDVKELKRFIMSYVNKQKNTKRMNLISMEWRTLALVLDRLFFVIYMFVIVFALLYAMNEYSKYPKAGSKGQP
ncbi:hypothetical protein Ciccas_006992 [Cichlidogyrus casuarinus]|uniref:Uncharacterized protein n=1 Tax=Cichlidogyrus casuarinus TaxID=1844966 RepID=A0ABD2Q834_9PLAT